MSDIHIPGLAARRKKSPAVPIASPGKDRTAGFAPSRIVLIDHPGSGAPDLATLTRYAAAMTASIFDDFAPRYQTYAIIAVGSLSDMDPTDYPLGLFRDADQPGALGYHEAESGKVFPLLDAQDGANLSATIDHEAKEALRDRSCNAARMGLDGKFWADEPADAVEQGEYERDGVKLSNFVTASWYSGEGGSFDFMGQLTAPLTVGPGGYAQYFHPLRGWQQIVHESRSPRTYRRLPHGRSARRLASWR